jgi:ATP-dependent RNA helicase DDX35
MVKALELLYSLGALDEYAKLTRPLGLRMAELAVEPMMAKTLLSAPSFGCLSEMLTIAAMTSLGGSVWFHHDGEKKKMENARRKFAVEEGDHLTLLNVYLAFITKGKKEAKFCHEHSLNFKSMTRAVSIRAQLKRYLERFHINVDETLSTKPRDPTKTAKQIRRCLTAGYFAHAARMQPDGTFRNVEGSIVLHAHPSSLLFHQTADWVIFHEVLETASKIFIRDVTKIEKNWLLEYAPEYYQVTGKP